MTIATSAGLTPRVTTERLVLREWRVEDFSAFERMYADDGMMRYLGGAVGTTEAWCRMAMHVGHWALRGYGKWVVERRSDGQVLGRVGLWEPAGWPDLEAAFALGPGFRGQGYALEALLAAMDWAWAFLDVPRLVSLVAVENEPARRLARRAGMTLRERAVVQAAEVDVFVLERPGAVERAHLRPSRAR